MLLHINFINRILLLLLFNTVCITSFAQALEDANVLFEEGCKFYDQKDTVNAFKSFQKASELGDSQAQTSLAIMYEKGEGVPQDYSQALYWYKKAAEQGDSYAQNNLAIMYENERGVSQDYSKAIYWYQKAADQGNVYAQNNLAYMYENGRGIPQDYSKAIYWYQKAAEQGFPQAQINLAMMYENERGVPRDYSKAIYWYKKAAEQREQKAVEKLISIYENGIGVPKDIEQAEYWRKKSDFVPLEGDELRIALIIGISDYNPRLENTEKDAHALHKALSNLNFEVETCINKEHDEMKKAIADFCEKAKGYGVAMIYYAGHAVQERGINYLIPARSETPIDYDDMKKKYISLSSVIDSLQKANVRKNIIIMDACRDSPEYAWRTRGGKKGLAPVDEPKHFLIAFSTQAGEIAEDGTGQNNSPYMTAFLEELKKPRQDIDAVMINVREKVIEMTNEKQIPFYKNNLEETEKKFFFNRFFNWN